jgi:alanine racemase
VFQAGFEPTAHIDLEALRHNLQVAARAAPAGNVMAVIKANGYGHGMVRVARAMEAADAFAVARVGEGVELREAGVTHPVLVLAGCHDADELAAAVAHDLQLVVQQQGQLDLLNAIELDKQLRCWMKVDTGMNRLGFDAKQAFAAFVGLQACTNVQGSPTLMTHLANADDLDDDYTLTQLRGFQVICEQFPVDCSVANSAGILGWPGTHADWQRPGIMLYGASPLSGLTATQLNLRPAMTFSARLIAVKHIKAGDPVGYGGIWRAPEDMPIGVLAVGYGDGYPREMPAGTPVLLNGKRAPLVGRVSMDTCALDLRGMSEARVGDLAVLWGEGLPADEIAQAAGTIAYTLFCGITARVRFTT